MASLYKRNGSNVWWVRFQQNGTRIQRSSGTTRKSQALSFLARVMEKERQRQEQGFKKVKFDVLCEEYQQQHLSFPPKSYHPHFEKCVPESDIEANTWPDEADQKDFIKELRSPEANDETRYMLLQADIAGGEGEVVFEPWFSAGDPGLLKTGIVEDWMRALQTEIPQ